MIRNYCTLFDINFLAKGLTLHNSLVKHSTTDWKLYILCLDEETYNLLKKLNLEKVSLISLDQIEDSELLIAKNNRNRTEYCWTLTPSLPLYLLNTKPEIDLITYLDADLFFYSSPEQIFEEFVNNSILLIPHNLPPEKKEKEKVVGKYNVGMMIFRRDQSGLTCLNWWRLQCNNWCYEVPEEGKLGDQKYLDYFEEKFSNVYILHHPGANLAGWNIKNYRGKINKINNAVYVNNKPLIFFHFSSFKLYNSRSTFLPNGPIGAYKYFLFSTEKNLIYNEYIKEIFCSYKLINEVSPNFTAGLVVRPSLITQIKEIIIPLIREYIAIKLNRRARKKHKTIIILEHNNGRLANQLWNYISIYAYTLEKNYRLNNYCFNTYAEYFNIPIDNFFIKILFYNRFNRGYYLYRRLNLYKLFIKLIKLILPRQQVVYLSSLPFYLSPSNNCSQQQKQILATIENSTAKNWFFSGWPFRNPVGLAKYRNEIIEYFKPKNDIQIKTNLILNSLRLKYTHLVGVHIRQDDYVSFDTGNFYFSFSEVRKILDEYLNFIKRNVNETVFVICSDDPIEASYFTGLNIALPNGNAIEDLFTLSKTDIIIGSNSTYGAMASYLGNIPMVVFERPEMDWDYYLNKHKYFENKKNTLVSY